ncbi:1866_t:CDS:1, partial [Ambispora leptoticha]
RDLEKIEKPKAELKKQKEGHETLLKGDIVELKKGLQREKQSKK